MKFTVPKETNRRQPPASSSFFVEGEQQKREEPLEVPPFMRRASAGAQKSGTTPQRSKKPVKASAPVSSKKRPLHKQKKKKQAKASAVQPKSPGGKDSKGVRGCKKRKRRGSKILYYLMFGILAFTILFILSITVFFRIDTIRVTGDAAADQSAVIAQSGIQIGDNLWRTNTAAAAERILSSHIEYDRVEIERELPSGIVINLIPSEVMAVCCYEGQYYSISDGGRIIAVSDTAPSGGSLPIVYGCVLPEAEYGDVLTQNDTNKLVALRTVLDAIEKNELTGVTHIDLSDLSTIRIYWQNRAELKFGSLDGLSYEVGCVKRLLESEVAEDEIVVIDDTLMNGTYYKRPVESLTYPDSSGERSEESSGEPESSRDISNLSSDSSGESSAEKP